MNLSESDCITLLFIITCEWYITSDKHRNAQLHTLVPISNYPIRNILVVLVSFFFSFVARYLLINPFRSLVAMLLLLLCFCFLSSLHGAHNNNNNINHHTTPITALFVKNEHFCFYFSRHSSLHFWMWMKQFRSNGVHIFFSRSFVVIVVFDYCNITW